MPQDDPVLKQAVGDFIFNIPAETTADELCQKYLKYIKAHVVTQLKNQYSDDVFNAMEVDWVLTMPAD